MLMLVQIKKKHHGQYLIDHFEELNLFMLTVEYHFREGFTFAL